LDYAVKLVTRDWQRRSRKIPFCEISASRKSSVVWARPGFVIRIMQFASPKGQKVNFIHTVSDEVALLLV
jgi:hypothetical protein